jgi:ethanolamine permease
MQHDQHVGTVSHSELKKTLSTLQLWGIAVGLVISGEYFGWSYGWGTAGTLGFVISAAFIALMYTTFIFSFTELTTSIPHAGGPFAYSRVAFGPTGGYLAGAATLVEFVFAPPAISLAIGAYLNVQFPALDPKLIAVSAYALFMMLNILGVAIAATFELFVTILAIVELCVFMGVVAPGFSAANFLKGGWAGHDTFSMAAIPGIFAAIPFAIWFFLAIEGVAMVAEEAKDPKKSIPRAYISGILTLVALAIGVMVFAGGAGDWTKLANINDPLPQAMRYIVGDNSGWLHMLVWLGLFGLVASFHGTVFGAIVMYIISMASLFKLRRDMPDMERPFTAPFYPYFPAFALIASVVCLIAMVYYNPLVAVIFAGLLLLGTFRFANLRDLLAKACPARSGDFLAGVAAADDEERVAA